MQTFDSLKKEWLKDEIRRSLLFEETSSNLHQGDKTCKAVVQIGTPFLGTRAVPRSHASRPGSWSSVPSCKFQDASCKRKHKNGVGGCGFVVGKSKRTWLTVERFTVLRAELQDLSSSLDDDLRSSLEGGGPQSGGGCARPAKARMFSGRKRPTGEEVRVP